MIRLDKFIADTTSYSRREIKAFIKGGLVITNGKTASCADDKIDENSAEVYLSGKKLEYNKYIYLMMNKPAGYVTSTDERGEHTVMELLDPMLVKQGVAPVGRLDKDTVGLLLFTNNGVKAHQIISPNHHVQKCYFARVSNPVSEVDVRAFAAGVTLKDGTVCRPALLETVPNSVNEVLVYVEEGKYHQVKRMLASRGTHVEYLKRISIGALELDEALTEGSYKYLSETELDAVFGDIN